MSREILPNVKALFDVARKCDASGDTTGTLTALNMALAMANESTDPFTIASALTNLAMIEVQSGEMTKSFYRFEEAISIFDQLGEKLQGAKARTNFSHLHRMQGRLDLAEPLMQEALDVFRERADENMIATMLGNYAILLIDQGREFEAEPVIREAVMRSEKIGNLSMAANYRITLARLIHSLGSREEAHRLFEQTKLELEASGNVRGLGILYGAIGNCLIQEHRYEEARTFLIEALQIHREVKNRRFEGAVLEMLGELSAANDDSAQTMYYYNMALQVVIECGDRRNESYIRQLTAQELLKQGGIEEAYHMQYNALEIARAVQDKLLEGRILLDIGQCHLLRQEKDEALVSFQLAQQIFTQIQQDKHADDAKNRIESIGVY